MLCQPTRNESRPSVQHPRCSQGDHVCCKHHVVYKAHRSILVMTATVWLYNMDVQVTLIFPQYAE